MECNSQGLGIRCFVILDVISKFFTFVISNSRGSVPIPLDNTHYVSVSELQKIFEICEESFKIPFGYGRR